MSHRFSPLIEQLIRDRMASGKNASEDELLRESLQSLDAEDAELRAIQEGLDSIDRGEQGVFIEEAFQQLRAKRCLRESP